MSDQLERRRAKHRRYNRKRSLKKLKKDKTKLHQEAEHFWGCYKSMKKMYQEQKRENIKLELQNNKIKK